MMDIEGLKNFVLTKINKESSPLLTYHSVFHTIDVLEAAESLMQHLEIDYHDYQIVQAACILHDTGMVITYEDHEIESVHIARKICPEFGFSGAEIDLVSEHIMATKMPQSPKTITEKIICDADLDYLGRPDFQMVSHRLRLEWISLLQYDTSLVKWYRDQEKFLRNHQYLMHLSRSKRDKGKEENLHLIRELLHGTINTNI